MELLSFCLLLQFGLMMKTAGQHAVGQAVVWGGFPNIPLTWQRVALFATLGIVFFLLGVIPFWLKARQAAEQRDAAQSEVRRNRIQSRLATAIIQAERGEYEPARQSTSDFFALLRDQLDSPAEAPAFTSAQRTSLRPLLDRRDSLINGLSRGDPKSAENLFLIYDSYSRLVRAP